MKQGKISVTTITVALAGVFLCGIGVGINSSAGLENDSVGLFYDGIRSFLGLTGEQLGRASNIVNIVLLILLILIGRKYESIGTFVYLLPYGLRAL